MPIEQPKPKPKATPPDRARPVSNDNEGDEDDKRGEVVTSGGFKIHGDELDGIIPGRASQPPKQG